MSHVFTWRLWLFKCCWVMGPSASSFFFLIVVSHLGLLPPRAKMSVCKRNREKNAFDFLFYFYERFHCVICSCAVCQLFQFPPLKSVCAWGVNLYKGEDGHVLVDTLGWLCIRPSLLGAVRRLGCHYSLLGLMVLAPLGAKDGELDMVTYF